VQQFLFATFFAAKENGEYFAEKASLIKFL
jgi:hypothetical protein